ncbi:MAG: hypothetical protein JEY91_04230 [Spirochaetaceae bacterium]|nr:hypothetical protein [Spirochaetaceae bacterium]
MVVVHKELSGEWKSLDYLGAFRVRLGIRRNQYRVEPGLYKLGNPQKESPVLVTANYKLTVDIVRRAVKGLDLWILVLDTKGINVWCAAGKGTFGTDELINRIGQVELGEIVSHRTLILPQLGAPGMTPVEVKRATGFSITYGPVEAIDIPDYIKAGHKASEKMRRKVYSPSERFNVALTHFSQGLLAVLIISAVFVLLDIVIGYKSGFQINKSLSANVIIAISSLITGSFLANLLLPLLPGRAFSLKGLFIGIVFSGIFLFYLFNVLPDHSVLYSGGKILFLLAFIVYQVLNLTGSSTYTSLSGVRKEMAVTIPLSLTAVVISLILIITGGFIL